MPKARGSPTGGGRSIIPITRVKVPPNIEVPTMTAPMTVTMVVKTFLSKTILVITIIMIVTMVSSSPITSALATRQVTTIAVIARPLAILQLVLFCQKRFISPNF